jgi:hypothetical protein
MWLSWHLTAECYVMLCYVTNCVTQRQALAVRNAACGRSLVAAAALCTSEGHVHPTTLHRCTTRKWLPLQLLVTLAALYATRQGSTASAE